MAAGDAHAHRRGDEGQDPVGGPAGPLARPVQRADQEQQAQCGERQALEDAQRAGLQPDLELQENRIGQQPGADQKPQQELGAVIPAQWIHCQHSSKSRRQD
ncbi:hypothetical protein D3C72_2081330 [compost metagenome]